MEELGITSGSTINSTYEAPDVIVDIVYRTTPQSWRTYSTIDYNRKTRICHGSIGYLNFTKHHTKRDFLQVQAHAPPLSSFLLYIQAYLTPGLRLNCMIYWKGSLTPEEKGSLLPITFALSGRMIGILLSTLTSLVGSFVQYLLIDNISVLIGNSVFRQVVGIPMGTNSAPLLADLFLHTFEYDFILTTFRYIDDLFSVNNDSFEEYISSIYPSEMELKDTTMASNEVCYLETRVTAHLTISACTTR